MSEYLIRIEGVNISNFVDDTTDLNTIRGGSLILLNAVRGIVDAVRPAIELREISGGASAGMYLYTGDDPDRVVALIREHLDEEPFRHATFVVDWVLAETAFLDYKELAIAKNRFRQMRSPSVAIPSNLAGATGACTLNRIRPAERGNCPSVDARREYGRDQKKEAFYLEYAGFTGRFVNDFGAMCTDPARGILNRKMAVVYIDGNKFGAARDNLCRSHEKLTEFDVGLRALRGEFLKDLLDYISHPERKDGWSNRGASRIETLLWGGDEIMFAVPAWQGWDLLRFFFNRTWNVLDTDLTHSAGLVFCHHNAPIRRIKQLAHALCDDAKARKVPNGNFFAYEILESFDHVGTDIETYRTNRVPEINGARADLQGLILPGAGMDTVAAGFGKLKALVPRRRLYRVADFLISGKVNVGAEIDDLLTEIGSTGRRLLRDLAQHLNSPVSSLDEIKDKPMALVHLNNLWDYLG